MHAKYLVVLLDDEGGAISDYYTNTLTDAKQFAAHMLSEHYARASETTHAAWDTHKVEIRDSNDECVWDRFYERPLPSRKLNSKKQLKQLLDLLMWANASDDIDNPRPPCYASQSHLFGKLWDAICMIVLAETDVDIGDKDWNLGGCRTYLDDLIATIDRETVRA